MLRLACLFASEMNVSVGRQERVGQFLKAIFYPLIDGDLPVVALHLR